MYHRALDLIEPHSVLVDYAATLLQPEHAIVNDKGEKDARRSHMVIETALKEACQDAELSVVCLPVYCLLA
jgi:hypothetical protein